MSLPIISKQQFVEKSKFFPKGKLTLTGFSVGQESIFLQVKDSQDEKEKMQALKQIIAECVVEKTPVGSLPLFVIEYLFLRLRQHSIGEIVELGYICKNEVDVPATDNEPAGKKECKTKMALNIDLREVQIVTDPEHTDKIMVTDKLGLKFKYPTIDSIMDKGEEATENDIIVGSIESIYSDEEVWSAADNSFEDMKEFYKNVSLLKKAEIMGRFFGRMPHIQYKSELKCSGCGKVHPVEFNSLNEVFH